MSDEDIREGESTEGSGGQEDDDDGGGLEEYGHNVIDEVLEKSRGEEHGGDGPDDEDS